MFCLSSDRWYRYNVECSSSATISTANVWPLQRLDDDQHQLSLYLYWKWWRLWTWCLWRPWTAAMVLIEMWCPFPMVTSTLLEYHRLSVFLLLSRIVLGFSGFSDFSDYSLSPDIWTLLTWNSGMLSWGSTSSSVTNVFPTTSIGWWAVIGDHWPRWSLIGVDHP